MGTSVHFPRGTKSSPNAPLVVSFHLGHGILPPKDTDTTYDPGAVVRDKGGNIVYTEREAIEGVAKYLDEAFRETGKHFTRPIQPIIAATYAKAHQMWPDGDKPPNRFEWPMDVVRKLIAEGKDVLQHHSLHFDSRSPSNIYVDYRADIMHVARGAAFAQAYHKAAGTTPFGAGSSRRHKDWIDIFETMDKDGDLSWKAGQPWPVLPHNTTLVQYSIQKHKIPARQLNHPMPDNVTATLIEAGNVREMYALKQKAAQDKATAEKQGRPAPDSVLEARYKRIAYAIAEGNYELSVKLEKNQRISKGTELAPPSPKHASTDAPWQAALASLDLFASRIASAPIGESEHVPSPPTTTALATQNAARKLG